MRRTGKTLAMVEALPEVGAIVVVHSGTMLDYVKRMIRDVRGHGVAVATQVRIVANYHDAQRALFGASAPVYVDHAFWQLPSREAFEEVRQLTEASGDLTGARFARPGPIAVSIEGDLKRLDIEEHDTLVFRTRRRLTEEQSQRIADQVNAFVARHGFREVRTLVLDDCSDLDVADRPQPRQEPRRTPFGCLEDPRQVGPFEVTSASISEAHGPAGVGRAPLRTAEG